MDKETEKSLIAADFSRAKLDRFVGYCLNDNSDALKLLECTYCEQSGRTWYAMKFRFMDYRFEVSPAESIAEGMKLGLVKLEEFFESARSREEELNKLIT